MSLIKNSAYNLLGFAIPTLIAVPALGILARWLGLELFGVFTLVFAVIGYASIFDLGLSRAVIREISIHRDNEDEQKKIISTSTFVIGITSLCAVISFYFLSDNLASLLNISEKKMDDVIVAFKVLSFTIPMLLLTQIWIAYLEGREEFAKVNLQKIISGTLQSLLPVLLCWYEKSLFFAVLGLFVGRIITLLLSFSFCSNIVLKSGIYFYKNTFKRLLIFGSWLTVSNIISPIMVYFDRFIIAHILGGAKVALYSAPSEGIMRVTNVPLALARALFPKIAFCKDKEERNRLEKHSYILINLVCLPIMIVGILFAQPLMRLWMGDEFGGVDAIVLQILLVGFYVNSMAVIPFSLLQANGNAKTTALVHLLEIVPYIFILFYMTYCYGIIGSAITWSLRMLIDFIILFILSKNR